ncbi:DUF1824 family protein [filamentous cyanobacterium LEGE 11480]|uniref:DUF1824 family protein n=1 Tax=Romeriopsis navalis LEGE 11480 TaxID=2777977 RepID=A0A928Z2E5_9CYAN|nr:DUF1824 family protein [Romeriopsis navalis]MBE9030301.1 DUF1824 family protein [Romeriopsis navalis LEGE 11480]
MMRDEAVKLLRLFTCIDQLPAAKIPTHEAIRDALAIVREHSDYQIFGICAESLAQGQQAMIAYIKAFDYKFVPEVPPIEGPIYIKYNPNRRSCHSDTYIGQQRGVLVSCQSAYDDDINELFGHLPLDLF